MWLASDVFDILFERRVWQKPIDTELHNVSKSVQKVHNLDKIASSSLHLVCTS